jgi:putative flippase GtrA
VSRPLADRVRAVGPEFVKFGVVGVICLAIDTALAYYFRFSVGLGPNTAKTLSTLLATFVSYALNRAWSFAHRVDEERGHSQDMLLYAVIAAAGLAITWVPITITHYGLTLQGKTAYLVSSTLGTGLATIFRFWAFRRWVFVNDPARAEKAALV